MLMDRLSASWRNTRLRPRKTGQRGPFLPRRTAIVAYTLLNSHFPIGHAVINYSLITEYAREIACKIWDSFLAFRVSRLWISMLYCDRFFFVRNVRDAESRNNTRISIIFFYNDYVINNKCVKNQRVFPRNAFEAVLTRLYRAAITPWDFCAKIKAKKLRVFLSIDETTRTIDYRGRCPPSFVHSRSAFLHCRRGRYPQVFLRIYMLIILHLCNSLFVINNI